MLVTQSVLRIFNTDPILIQSPAECEDKQGHISVFAFFRDQTELLNANDRQLILHIFLLFCGLFCCKGKRASITDVAVLINCI